MNLGLIILLCAVFLLLIFVLFILLRAAFFRPPILDEIEKEHNEMKVSFSKDDVVDHLAQMIRIPTVSFVDSSKSDTKQFEAFQKLLKKLYPHVSKHCPRELVGPSGVLYHWKGRNADSPTVLMAHYDVVPALETGWVYPPFSGTLDSEGVLWGRGTIDTKITLCGILEAVESHIKNGFIPENDIWISFSGDEEVFGASAPAVVSLLESRGIQPSMVLDEGGAVVSNVFPGVTRPSAVIGIAEKGLLNVEMTVNSNGGHASAPPRRQGVAVLADAISSVVSHPSPARLTGATAAMFDTLGRFSSYGYRILFANITIFLPLLKLFCRLSGGELNAMMRTTHCFTTLEGGPAFNVMPSAARSGINIRILTGETVDGVLARLKKRINNTAVELSVAYGNDPSPVSDIKTDVWKVLTWAVRQTWPQAIPSPYLMVACSDSRHFSRICPNVYKFSAMELTKDERETMHGRNERIPSEKIVTCCEFFWRLISKV
ncbi:MAG TPA: M20/M25/M40 family metallo-hydrolase [Treponemataceae bacterium]|nr:M20/M25/M40 family metallo-hydrolase [Treponemataceae bacterium]